MKFIRQGFGKIISSRAFFLFLKFYFILSKKIKSFGKVDRCELQFYINVLRFRALENELMSSPGGQNLVQFCNPLRLMHAGCSLVIS